MQQWMQFVATADGLCNLAAAAVNLAVTIIKYRRERRPTGREACHRPVGAEGSRPRPLAQPCPEYGQDLRDQGRPGPARDQPGGDELGRDRDPAARLAEPNAATPTRKTRRWPSRSLTCPTPPAWRRQGGSQ